MRDPYRIKLYCDKLAECWRKVPDWRFGQLISNVLGDFQAKFGDIFFPEEKDMFDFFCDYFEVNKKLQPYTIVERYGIFYRGEHNILYFLNGKPSDLRFEMMMDANKYNSMTLYKSRKVAQNQIDNYLSDYKYKCHVRKVKITYEVNEDDEPEVK